MVTAASKEPRKKEVSFGVKLESLLSQIEGQLGIVYKVYLNTAAEEVLCSAVEYSKDNDFTVSLLGGGPSLIHIRELTCSGADSWFDDDGAPASPLYVGITPKLIELIELLVQPDH